MTTSRYNRGFTLLEVTLAVGLLALILAAVYGAFHTGILAWKTATVAAEDIATTRAVLDDIGELVRSVVAYDQSDDDQQNDNLYAFEGIHGQFGDYDADSITFVTLSSRFLSPAEKRAMPLRRVRLALEQDESLRPYLAVYNYDALSTSSSEALPQKLCDNVVGFRVRYYDGDLGDWQEEWVDEPALPAQVEVTVTYVSNRDGPAVVQQLVAPVPARDALDEQAARKSRAKPRSK